MTTDTKTNVTLKPLRYEILKIVVIYSIVGGLWIYLSDTFLALIISDPVVMSKVAIYKGLAFIILTASLLYLLISRYARRISIHITELNQVQHMFNRQKTLLDIVVEGTTDAVYIKDVDGRYLLANTAVANFVKKPIKDIIGYDDYHLFPAVEAKVLMTRDQWVMAQDSPQTYEEHLTTPEGERYFLSTKGAVRDENGVATGIFGVARDISERKLAEADLKKSEEKFYKAFNASPEAISINTIDDGKYIDVNEAFIAITGFEKDEIIGHTSAEFGFWIDLNERHQFIAELSKTGSVKNYDVRYRMRNKEERDFLLSSEIIEVDGRRCSLNFIMDITERKRVEEERLDLEKQLLQAQKMESLGVLAGGIAHDFNNILAVIMGRCALAKLKPEHAGENIPLIEKAAERAAELCRQMLAYAGKTQYVQKEVNVGELVDEMVNMLKATINHNAVIMNDRSTDVSIITGDASQIRQIVMNLIINASDAIGEAHGNIAVSLANTEIRAGQLFKDHLGRNINPGNYVCLEVADDGCGMDDETMQRIFEPFYSTKFAGRGLGMSATLGIISAHQGALQLSSRPGKGTSIKVYLPRQVSESSSGHSQQLLTPSIPWQCDGTILLVEDEVQIRVVAKSMLEEFGFAVIEAANGKEALELYQKYNVNITLVVSDIGMPIMDGYELIREMKTLNPYLPIIVSSGFGDTVVTSRIAHGDIAGLISKPYRFDQLQEVLRSVVEEAKSAHE